MLCPMDDGAPTNLIYPGEVFRIQGALFEVFRTMGPGFLESIYQQCAAIEFAKREIPFEALKALPVEYKGERLGSGFVADFVCFDRIIIELKAVRAIAPEHRAQTINYLRATGLKLALLVNFGASPKLQIERFAL